MIFFFCKILIIVNYAQRDERVTASIYIQITFIVNSLNIYLDRDGICTVTYIIENIMLLHLLFQTKFTVNS